MTFLNTRVVSFSLVLLGGALLLSPRGADAQEIGDGFLFEQPRATLTFNLGYGVPSAGSDFFDYVTTEFTLDKGDFRSAVFGGGLSFFLNERLDLAFEFSFARSSSWSHYQSLLDWGPDEIEGTADDLEIEQQTEFTRMPFTVSARYFLTDRGRSVGSLSWIPASWAPYVGAGGGKMYYEFKQYGDLVDYIDYSIYRGEVLSEGWAWVGHVFGGVQWAISPHWIVTAEGRYSLADADLDRPAFSGYEPIDLSGFQGSIGFGIRF